LEIRFQKRQVSLMLSKTV